MRLAGVRTSRHRVLRLMREYALPAPTRVATPRGPRNHDGTIIADALDTMWGTDMTTTWTHEGQVAVFIAVDHHNAECVGIHAARHGTRFEALEPLRQGVRQQFGAFAKGMAQGLSVRHDHGSQYMSAVFQDELAFLGAESSRPTSGHRRETAAPSGSSARSRRTCSGCRPSTPSSSCVWPCWTSAKPTELWANLGDGRVCKAAHRGGRKPA